MGKKSKNNFTQNKQIPKVQKQQKISLNKHQFQSTQLPKADQNSFKISKKEKKKIKKYLKSNKIKQVNKNFQGNNSLEQQEVQNSQQQVINIQQSSQQQSLISLTSQIGEEILQNQDQFQQQLIQNEIDFNTKGKQGFQDLIKQSNCNNSSQAKYLQITRTNKLQKLQNYFLYHIKQNIFYKVISTTHQKVNLTHLNQNISIHVVQQQLLKNNIKQKSLDFIVNRKIIGSKIDFIKSTIFKVKQMQNIQKQIWPYPACNKKQKLKDNKIKNNKYAKQPNTKIQRENIQTYLKPSDIQTIQKIQSFLQDFQWNQQCLLLSKQKLSFTETSSPFENFNQKILQSNSSLLILGKKNSGKSTLAQYIFNTNQNSVCILQCDIGRSLTISGCVSLITKQDIVNIWIGQFTPFNCIKLYLNAIQQLYSIYREKYFTKKLVINTMGYLSGLGEFILYQIYNIINPSELIVLSTQNQTVNTNLTGNVQNIMNNLKSGIYLQKLLRKQSQANDIRKFNQKKINLQVFQLKNNHSQSKGIPIRYENILVQNKSIKNIIELIRMIKRNQLQSIVLSNYYGQDKLGNVRKINCKENQNINMRIMLIGQVVQRKSTKQQIQMDQSEDIVEFYRIFGIGYGFQNKVYFSNQQILLNNRSKFNIYQQCKNIIGLVVEGVDFQKNFYIVNQFNLINLELEYGSIPYIMPIIKGMGSKGTRNNPSKNI